MLMDARGEPWERRNPYLQRPPCRGHRALPEQVALSLIFQQKWPWISLPVARGLGLAAGAGAHTPPALGAGRDGGELRSELPLDSLLLGGFQPWGEDGAIDQNWCQGGGKEQLWLLWVTAQLGTVRSWL